MNFRKYIAPLLLLIAASGYSQVSQPYRYEIEKKFNEDEFTIISAKEEGLILFRDKDQFMNNSSDLWEFIFLDTTLTEYQHFELDIDQDYTFLGYDYRNGKFYLLFQKGFSSKGDWVVKTIGLKSGEIDEYQIKNDLDIELSHFIISGSSMVLGGAVEAKPTVVLYSFGSGKTSVLPGFYRKETKLVDLRSNSNKTFNVVLLDESKVSNDNILSVKVFSHTGIELIESVSNFGRDLKVQTGSISKLKTDHLIVAGTYGDKGSKLSKGFYFINVQPGNNNQISFLPFTELNNLFDYLPDRRKSRVISKINESGASNPYEYKVTVAVYDIFEENNQYTLFAEIIDPQYGASNTSMNNYRPYYYNPYYLSRNYYYRNMYDNNIRDEIVSVKLQEALTVTFDNTGKYLYDFALPIEGDIETPDIMQYSSAYKSNNLSHMIYKVEDEGLKYSYFEGTNEIVSDSLITIKPLELEDEIKDDEETGTVSHWYNSNYFVWGVSKIQNKSTKERRNVFYINKITFD